MREVFVAELVKEVLGPRQGVREVLVDSPLGEYIAGVLAPATAPVIADPDADAELPEEDSEGEGDDTNETSFSSLSPVLSPQSRASSLGISFVVESGGDGSSLKICRSRSPTG